MRMMPTMRRPRNSFSPHTPYASTHVLIYIREQREVQVELVDELLVRVQVVGTDAEHDEVLRVEIVLAVAEPAGLLGASRRVVLRIEIQNHLRSAQGSSSAMVLPLDEGKGKGWGLVAGFEVYGHRFGSPGAESAGEYHIVIRTALEVRLSVGPRRI